MLRHPCYKSKSLLFFLVKTKNYSAHNCEINSVKDFDVTMYDKTNLNLIFHQNKTCKLCTKLMK